MNFFFGINNKIFKSEIQIPIFKNRDLKISNLKLFKCYPKNNKWVLEKLYKKKVGNYFFILKNNDILNNEIYFLSDEKIYDYFDMHKLKDFNNFTDTIPKYRANFKIYLSNGGFSSYQSEYPFSMVKKNGSILSSIYSLSNIDADKNYIFIKNIFERPIEESFKAYLVNYKNKNIEMEYSLKTNNINCLELNKKHIKPEIFLVTRKYLGVPMYISVKNKAVSFEHTHPPHEYILSKNKFIKVTDLKKEINEIIY